VTIQRMDHVGVVVDDLETAISFFVELGMELDGGTTAVEASGWTASSDSTMFESRSRSCARPTATAGPACPGAADLQAVTRLGW